MTALKKRAPKFKVGDRVKLTAATRRNIRLSLHWNRDGRRPSQLNGVGKVVEVGTTILVAKFPRHPIKIILGLCDVEIA